MTPEPAEVVVVGGGAAGCVLARRLAEGGRSVLLLEAGPDLGARVGPALLDGWRNPQGSAWGYRLGLWIRARCRRQPYEAPARQAPGGRPGSRGSPCAVIRPTSMGGRSAAILAGASATSCRRSGDSRPTPTSAMRRGTSTKPGLAKASRSRRWVGRSVRRASTLRDDNVARTHPPSERPRLVAARRNHSV
jgi:choline dehydrogenase-like flavoprotein